MLIVIDTPKMVESSVVPPGPRSTASPTNKPIDVDADLDLVTLNNNNNHEYHGVENEKGQNGVDPINDGQLIIGNGDNANPKNEKLSQAEYKVLEEISVEDDVAEEDDTDEEEDYQDADEDEGAEEDFESLDEDEADEDEEDEPPETETCTGVGGRRKQGVGAIPDVLLNELHEILVTSSSAREKEGDGEQVVSEESSEEDDDDSENGESWSSSSSSSDSGCSPVLEILEAIPEEEEDWDSDSTLTEQSGGGHAQPLSEVSTQILPPSPEPPSFSPELFQPSPSVLPGPTFELRLETQSADFLQKDKGPLCQKVQQHLEGSLTSGSDCSSSSDSKAYISSRQSNKLEELSPETVPTPQVASPTPEPLAGQQCSSGDSGNESGSPTGRPVKKKKSVTFSGLNDPLSHEEEGTGTEFESSQSGESPEEVISNSSTLIEEKASQSDSKVEETRISEKEHITKSTKTQTNGSSDKLLDKSRPFISSSPLFSSQEKVQSARYESAAQALQKSTPRKKCVTFNNSFSQDEVVVRESVARESKKETEDQGRGASDRSAGVEGEQNQQPLAPSSSLASSAPLSGPASEYFVIKLLAAEQQRQLDLVDLTRLSPYDGGRELSKFIEASTAGSYFSDNNCSADTSDLGEMHQRLSSSCSEHQHLPPGPPREKPRSVLRKTGASVKRSGRNVSFNESLNLFYEAECQCWIHEDDYARLRHEEQMQQQLIYEQATQLHQLHHHHQHHNHHNHAPYLTYDPPPLEFEDTPTLSPPEGYKDRFFPHMDPHQQQLHYQQQQQQLQQQSSQDPDVTRVSPPSPPAARRKVFLKENSTEQQPLNHTHSRPILNGLEEEEDEEGRAKKSSRFGGIGRLWRSNSSDPTNKKGSSPSADEPDLVKCTEKNEGDEYATNYPGVQNQSQQVEMDAEHEVLEGHRPTQVSIGTAPLRTSEQIRLAVDSTLRISRSKNKKQECSSLVEKLRWLTSLDDEDSDSQSGFATWPSRDKNGLPNTAPNSSNSSSSRKSDAGTSTSEEFVHPNLAMRHPVSSNEAKIKQISYTLEDIDEGLKGGENELETFITEDGGRMERIRRRYGEDVGGDDYGFSRRPSVKGIKPKFSSTNQIFAQFTRAGAETPIPQMQLQLQMESQYENTRLPPSSVSSQNSHYDPLPLGSGGVGGDGGNGSGARVNLNYDQFPPNPPPTSSSSGSSVSGNGTAAPVVRPGIASNEESRSHFEMIRQSFEQASFVNYNRPHSWSVSTLPHNHTGGHVAVPGTTGQIPLPGMANNLSGSALNIQQSGPPQGQPQQPQNNLSLGMAMTMNGGGRPNSMPMMAGGPAGYGTLPSQSQHQQNMMMMAQQQQQQQVGPGGQPIYGTVRRVPNVIGRPLFLHYGALSVEAHPNKLVQPYPPTKVPETPSPTQPQPQPQQAPAPINNIKYYGPPIRYYQNPPPPVPPRSATTTIGGNGRGPPDCIGLERGNPEGATDEEQVAIKEPYSMNV